MFRQFLELLPPGWSLEMYHHTKEEGGLEFIIRDNIGCRGYFNIPTIVLKAVPEDALLNSFAVLIKDMNRAYGINI